MLERGLVTPLELTDAEMQRVGAQGEGSEVVAVVMGQVMLDVAVSQSMASQSGPTLRHQKVRHDASAASDHTRKLQKSAKR
jgi:hypothetical protein